MIVCGRCGRENLPHYKFCLGCGVELGREVRAPAPVAMPAPAAMPPPAAASTASVAAPVGGAGAPSMPAAVSPAVGPVGWQDPTVPPPTAAPPILLPTPHVAPAPHLSPMPAASPMPVAAPMGGAGAAPTAMRDPGALAAPAPAAVDVTPACPACGAKVPADFAFCGSCGARMAPAEPTAQKTIYFGAQPVAAPAPAPRGKLVLIRPDGSEGGSHPLEDGENLVGRGAGALFDGDAYLSPRHAVVTFGPAGAIVEDLGSLNGVFLKLTQEEEIQNGDVFRVGQELMRFDAITEPRPLDDGTEIMGSPSPGYWGRLSVVVAPGVDGASYPLLAGDVIIGRERGDIIFSDDGYVSGAHCRVSMRGGRFYVADIGSSNGTFLRIREARVIPRGRFLLAGQQLFRIEYS